jgi:hypothetical protein
MKVEGAGYACHRTAYILRPPIQISVLATAVFDEQAVTLLIGGDNDFAPCFVQNRCRAEAFVLELESSGLGF